MGSAQASGLHGLDVFVAAAIALQNVPDGTAVAIVAWHRAHVSNGPTEAVNNLIKRIKRIGFGLRRFAHYRLCVLLYAGCPNWDLLATTDSAQIREPHWPDHERRRPGRPRERAPARHAPASDRGGS